MISLTQQPFTATEQAIFPISPNMAGQRVAMLDSATFSSLPSSDLICDKIDRVAQSALSPEETEIRKRYNVGPQFYMLESTTLSPLPSTTLTRDKTDQIAQNRLFLSETDFKEPNQLENGGIHINKEKLMEFTKEDLCKAFPKPHSPLAVLEEIRRIGPTHPDYLLYVSDIICLVHTPSFLLSLIVSGHFDLEKMKIFFQDPQLHLVANLLNQDGEILQNLYKVAFLVLTIFEKLSPPEDIALRAAIAEAFEENADAAVIALHRSLLNKTLASTSEEWKREFVRLYRGMERVVGFLLSEKTPLSIEELDWILNDTPLLKPLERDALRVYLDGRREIVNRGSSIPPTIAEIYGVVEEPSDQKSADENLETDLPVHVDSVLVKEAPLDSESRFGAVDQTQSESHPPMLFTDN